MNVLEVLNGHGHLQLVWDESDAAQVANAREEVARLKAAGYSFFQVDGSPADEVAAGHGELRCRRVDEPPGLCVPPLPVEGAPSLDDFRAGPIPEPTRRRGRPPGGTRTVAVRPQAGG